MDTSNFSSEPPGNPGEDTSFPAPEAPAPPASSETGQPEAAAPAAPNSRSNGGRNNFRNRRFRGRKQNRQGGQQNRGNGQSNGSRGVFTGPMDHSYRQQNNNENTNQGQGSNRGGGFGRRNRFRQQFKGRKGSNQVAGYQGQNEIRPVDPAALHEDAATRIFAFVEDLFFMTKIMDTARKLNVKIAFVKTFDELMEKVEIHADEKPSLVIFDLNNVNAKPLTTIPKIRSKLKKGTSILGFVSHVQGDLKMKAQEAGCDSVMPRSAFSQNLPALLRRHGAPEEPEQPE